ncbi:hypothetical protein HRI_000364900 [Hibiscus trionum]|uniref:Uncharacterized protein n=1 Tax=Hibiscus trionum TaxID=183268 RepID=A0A9W7GZM7_HIBTR|nr:hypothetical protein HRI_000364900 [Hibiscus trionum]
MADSYSTRRFLGKSLFVTFFLIAIPLFPSQAPEFINQTTLNKFWELLHLLFIGIAVSYGLFGTRNVDNVSHDDSHSYASGIPNFSSVFEDCFGEHSMYYSGQGKVGSFNVKNGSFENPFEENVVQAWSSKYVQGEPTVVLAQSHCELGSFIDHKPLGLPVRSLKSRVEGGVSPEFGNVSSVIDSSDSSDKSETGGFSELGSENLVGKYNESDVLGSPIAWRSRSVRMRQRVAGRDATRPSHFKVEAGVSPEFGNVSSVIDSSDSSDKSESGAFSDLGPENLVGKYNESDVLGSPIASRSRSVRMRQRVDGGDATRPSHFKVEGGVSPEFGNVSSVIVSSDSSDKSESGGFSDLGPENLVGKYNESDVLGSPIAWRSRSVRMRQKVGGVATRPSHFKVEAGVSPEFGNVSSVIDSSDSSDKSESGGFSDLGPKILVGKYNESDVLCSPIACCSRSVSTRQRVDGGGVARPSHFRPLSVDGGGVARPSHFRPLSVDETQFRSLKSRSLLSQPSSHSPSTLSPSHSSSSESLNSKMIESPKERSSRRSFPHTSVNASHSQHYGDGSLLGTHSRICFKDELKESRDRLNDDSSSNTKEWISGYPLKFDAKPVAPPPSKAYSRGKSVRTFRTSRVSGSTRGTTDAGEKRENHTKGKSTMGSEGSKGESKPKFEQYNLPVGFKRQNLGGNSDIQNPTFSKNQNREKQECLENSESETEDEEFRVSSGEETISGTFSVAGSDSYEVDRKAGEFIAKFREQIRLQRTTSIDSTKGLNTSVASLGTSS